MYHNRMLSISYQDQLSPQFFNAICNLINKLYASRKYRSNVRLYVTANYEINKGVIFFSFRCRIHREHGIERSLVRSEKNLRRFYLPR